MPQATVQKLYIAYFGRPADPAGLAYYAKALEAGTTTVEAIATSFADSAEAQEVISLSALDFVEAVYQQAFGRAYNAEVDGTFWVDAIENGATTKELAFIQILEGAQNDDLATVDNKVAVAAVFTNNVNEDAYTDEQTAQAKALLTPITADAETVTAGVVAAQSLAETLNATAPEPQPEPVDGEIFYLTSGTDRLVGTDDDDFFDASLAQNPMVGGISNTLSSADRIDGGAGNDTLYAELVTEFQGIGGSAHIDVQPTVRNVETIQFEARDLVNNHNTNFNTGTITVDAKKITDVVRIGSKNSDGDLIIENLTTLRNDGSARNTDELIITMDHTDNFNSDNDASDLTVYFDEDYLLTGQSSEAQAFYFLLDEDADLAGLTNRLDKINVDGLRFTLGDSSEVIDLDSPEAQTAGTHVGFVAALQARLAELIAEGKLPSGTTLTLDETITDVTYLDNGAQSLPIPAIVLTSGDGTKITPVGFSQVQDAIGEYDVYGRFNAESEVTDNPLAVGIELHKAGREGEGGNLIVGGKELDSNTPNTTEGRGINVFNVDVLGRADKLSNLGQLSTTNDALEEVYIRTAAQFRNADDHAALTIRGLVGDTPGASGKSLRDANSLEAFGQDYLKLVNANEFLGDLALGGKRHNTSVVVPDFGAVAFNELKGLIGTGSALNYYWENGVDNLVTLQATGGGDVSFYGELTGDYQENFSYTTGAGNDLIVLDVDGDAVDNVNSSLTVTTGAGNDTVIVFLDDDVSQETMFLLDNLDINTGSGDDTVIVNGIGLFDIKAGDGSDFVYINTVGGEGGEWSFGNETGVQPFGVPENSTVTAGRVLYNAELTVKFAGFESKVVVNTTTQNNYVATQLDINAAIVKAIADSPELSRLLATDATTGSGLQELNVWSTVDGLNDLAVSLYQPTLTTTSTNVAGQTEASSTVLNSIKLGLLATTPRAVVDSTDLANAAAIANVFNTNAAAAGAGSLDAAGTVVEAGVAGLGEQGRGIYDFLAPNAGGSADADTQLNFSVINMGKGANDLVVLDSNADSANTLVIDDTFGKVSIVNFFVVDPDSTTGFIYDANSVGTDEAPVGKHRLDFTKFLDNQLDPSANGSDTSSAVPLEVTLNTDVTAEANSVTILEFNGVGSTISFANLTAAQLVAALNGTSGSAVTGGLVDGSLNAAVSTATLVGTVQDHIIMVENVQNQGEYKVFHLTSSTATNTGDFGVGTGLLGTLDFGYSIDGVSGLANVNLVGSADYIAAIDAFLGL